MDISVSTNSDQTAPWEQKKKKSKIREKKKVRRRHKRTRWQQHRDRTERWGRKQKEICFHMSMHHVVSRVPSLGIGEGQSHLKKTTSAASTEPFSHSVTFTHRRSRQSRHLWVWEVCVHLLTVLPKSKNVRVLCVGVLIVVWMRMHWKGNIL